ncbi:TPA: hypothetical protein DIV48_03935 [Candidatus Kaiserbacteria bacterium]|nr:MAG: hypothetical protein UY93_C0001G0007 [Parcubacteria group bacterium GW2011_GWA1_56_13]KKW47012.1 MAG: hypothetical protein UY97_C0001G0069 [Parcubacteria group bacterium GW2011_GWB1_57_6]HCR52757.1 hypothetical protein [Candidatus Kaiserbacteria bacterium]
MEHDAWFFIGVFVFIFLIWVATGGPLHPLAFTGPTLAQPDVLGGGTYLQLPRASFGTGGSNVVLPGSSSGESSYGAPSGATPPVGRVPGVAFSLPSPYSNIVSMNSYVSNASSSDPGTEYVEISVAQNASASIKLTGWILESGATGNAEIIPKGTRVPTSGVVNAQDDIVLEPGERAIIISGESPVGASFRENKCIGYFGSFQKFSPSLPLNCPSASAELSSFYGTPYIHDPSCIDYGNTLLRCQVAIPSSSAELSNTCQSFIETRLNYNGCVTAHRADSDFNGDTWRIYLGREEHMWRAKHEVVKLLDDRGKTVASFNY